MKHTTKNILTRNKPTGMSIKLFIKLCLTLIFLSLCTATVEAVIPVPDCDPLISFSDRSKGLRKVVDDWIAGDTKRATVETTYGLIQDWDTSRVTSMYYLFYKKKTFDANISKWNVAEVTNMENSTCQFPLFNSPLHHLLFFFFLSACSNVYLFFNIKKIASYVLFSFYSLFFSFGNVCSVC